MGEKRQLRLIRQESNNDKEEEETDINTTTARNQIGARLRQIGPGWTDRRESGYTGPAWFDLPKGQVYYTTENGAGGSGNKRLRSPGSRRSFNYQGIPENSQSWIKYDIEEEKVVELLSKYKDQQEGVKQRQTISNAKDSCESPDNCAYDAADKQEVDGGKEGNGYLEDEMERIEVDEGPINERAKKLLLEKAEMRRLNIQLENRVKYKHGVESLPKLEHPDYHFVRTIALTQAKRDAGHSQSSAIRRNWQKIKTRFQSSGGVMPLGFLRQVLLDVGITAPHAGRIVLLASELLGPGEDLVAFEDFRNQYFDEETLGESSASEEEYEDALDAVPFFLKAEEDSNEQQGEEEQQGKFARYQQKIRAAVKAKGIAIGCPGGFEQVIEKLGSSSQYHKLLYCEFVKKKAHRRTLAMLTTKSSTNSPTAVRHAPTFRESDYTANFRIHDLNQCKSLLRAAQVTRNIASSAIQCIARGCLVRLRAEANREELLVQKVWRRKSLKIAKIWFAWSKRAIFMRKHVWKVLCRWKSYVRAVKRKREFFRLCYWPFFTWRKFAAGEIRARGKARFLRQVWLALVQMRCLRGWHNVMVRSKEVMVFVSNKINNIGERIQSSHFLAWQAYFRNEKRLNTIMLTDGQALCKRVMMPAIFEAWCGLKVFSRTACINKYRACKYYSFAPWKSFKEKHHMSRLELKMPSREYRSYPVPAYPNLEKILGSTCFKFVAKDAYALEVLTNYVQRAKDQDRINRITRCIERNRVGPLVLQKWREFVEANQKHRYAWFHFVQGLQKKAFRTWYNTLPAKVRKQRKATRIIRKSKATTQKGVVKKVLIQKEEEEQEQRQQQEQEEARQSEREIEQQRRRRSTFLKQQERTQWQKQLIHDNTHRRITLSKAQKEAMRLRRERFARKVQLERHEERLEGALRNAELSQVETERMLEAKRRELQERKDLQMANAEALYKNRARMLHDVLYNVFDGWEQEQNIDIKRKVFRCLRFPIVYRKSFGQLQRKRLENWVRICVQLRKLWRAMPKYRALRIKWRIFNTWLKFMDHRYQHETPGLREQVARRKALLFHYSEVVSEYGLSQIERTAVDQWFIRWKEYTQKAATRRFVVERFRARGCLLHKQRVLDAWRSGLRVRHTAMLRPRCFASVRIEHDIDKYKCKLLNNEPRLLSTKLRSKNRFVRHRLQLTVTDPRREFSYLKQVLVRHAELTKGRIELESRLLCSAFEERATFAYNDVLVGPVGLQVEDESAQTKFHDVEVTASTNVASVLVGVSDGMVVSLQLKLRSGTDTAPRTWHSPVRGFVPYDLESAAAVAAAKQGHGLVMTQGPSFEVFEFAMTNSKERLQTIEGYALDHVVGGKIRFKTSHGRTSPWYGQGDAGTRFLLPQAREINCFGKMRFVDEFIVGFHGHSSATSIMSLGIVLRQVDQINVFSRCWMDRTDSLIEDSGGGNHPGCRQYRATGAVYRKTASHARSTV